MAVSWFVTFYREEREGKSLIREQLEQERVKADIPSASIRAIR
jgi:hypothetical protein